MRPIAKFCHNKQTTTYVPLDGVLERLNFNNINFVYINIKRSYVFLFVICLEHLILNIS